MVAPSPTLKAVAESQIKITQHIRRRELIKKKKDKMDQQINIIEFSKITELRSNLADCHEVFANSLFLMGEIGGNDFNYPLFIRRSIVEIKTYVPHVISAITSAINVRLYYMKQYLSALLLFEFQLSKHT